MHVAGQNPSQHYNLTRLYEYVGTDPTVVKDMVSLFLKNLSESLSKMNTFRLEGNSMALAREAHKIKTSLQIFGFDDLIETLLLLEKSGDKLPEDVDVKIAFLQNRINQGIEALRQDFGL